MCCDDKGSIYSGEFFNDMIHGDGMMKYSDGAAYNGYWVNNARDGSGSFFWVDGNEGRR